MVKEVKVPFVTTSVNLAGEAPMSSLENINDRIRAGVDYIVYEGTKNGKPSTVVNLLEGGEKVVKR